MKQNKKDKGPILFLLLNGLIIGSILIGAKYLPLNSKANKLAELPEMEIVVATDLHYISPELTNHGCRFLMLDMSSVMQNR